MVLIISFSSAIIYPQIIKIIPGKGFKKGLTGFFGKSVQ